jgi:hypothetical protein
VARRRIRPLVPPPFDALLGTVDVTPATEEDHLLFDVLKLIGREIAAQNRVVEKLDAEVQQLAPLADLSPLQRRAFHRARRRFALAIAKLDQHERAHTLIRRIALDRIPRKEPAP